MSRKLSLSFRVWIVVVMLTLVLFGMIARKQWTLAVGTPVILETQPVDPRSLFRGDYVRLNYTINTLDSAKYPALSSMERGDVIYLSLVPSTKVGIWLISDLCFLRSGFLHDISICSGNFLIAHFSLWPVVHC